MEDYNSNMDYINNSNSVEDSTDKSPYKSNANFKNLNYDNNRLNSSININNAEFDNYDNNEISISIEKQNEDNEDNEINENYKENSNESNREIHMREESENKLSSNYLNLNNTNRKEDSLNDNTEVKRKNNKSTSINYSNIVNQDYNEKENDNDNDNQNDNYNNHKESVDKSKIKQDKKISDFYKHKIKNFPNLNRKNVSEKREEVKIITATPHSNSTFNAYANQDGSLPITLLTEDHNNINNEYVFRKQSKQINRLKENFNIEVKNYNELENFLIGKLNFNNFKTQCKCEYLKKRKENNEENKIYIQSQDSKISDNDNERALDMEKSNIYHKKADSDLNLKDNSKTYLNKKDETSLSQTGITVKSSPADFEVRNYQAFEEQLLSNNSEMTFYNESIMFKVLERFRPKLVTYDSESKEFPNEESLSNIKLTNGSNKETKKTDLTGKIEGKKDLMEKEKEKNIPKVIIENANYQEFVAIQKFTQHVITEIIFESLDINSPNTTKESNNEGASLTPFKLKNFNPNNSMIKVLLYNAYNLPFSLIYFNWKTYFMLMITNWKLQEDALVRKKYSLNYLLLKNLVVKLMKNKKNDLLPKHFILNKPLSLITNKKNAYNAPSALSVQIEDKHVAQFSFLPFSPFSIAFASLIDVQCVYFLIMCPIVFSTKNINSTIFSVDKFFHLIYFLNVLKQFRSLRYTEENVLIKSMIEVFFIFVKKVQFWLDLLSLFPFLIFTSGLTNEYSNEWFFYFYLFPLLRVSSFGSTIKILEKTRYVFYIRMTVLISKFIIFAHWIGFLFFRYHSFNVLEEDISISNSCVSFAQGEEQLTGGCYAVLAEYYGSYIIPGQYFNGLTLMETRSQYNTDYSFLYGLYFIGLIITAYIFGGVNDLIRNMNQANNIFTVKIDEAKSLMLFYNFDTTKFTEINQFYENLWQKQRQVIYGKDLFSQLPQSLKNKILATVDPHLCYIMRTLYSVAIPNRKQKYLNCLHQHMKTYIAAPYERLYVRGELIKGLFILRNGKLIFSTEKNEKEPYTGEDMEKPIKLDDVTVKDKLENTKLKDKRSDIHSFHTHKSKRNEDASVNKDNNNANHSSNKLQETVELYYNVQILREEMKQQIQNLKDESIKFQNNSKDYSMFPLDSVFFKTGRAVETCFTDDFCELFIISLEVFDNILFVDFSQEMEALKLVAVDIGKDKIGKNKQTREIVMKHSSRSVGDYYEKEYDYENIWIEVSKYIPFISKVQGMNSDHLFSFLSQGLVDVDFKMLRDVVIRKIGKLEER